MTHATITPKQMAPVDVRTALTMYVYRFLDAYGGLQPDPLVALGAQETTDALDEKYPITVGDPLFQKLVNGAAGYRELGELYWTMITDVYQDGVREKATRLRTSQWARRGWGNNPAKQAAAAMALKSRLVATALMAGKTTASVENVNGGSSIKIFQTGHPCDPFGGNSQTWDNLFTSKPLNLENVQAVRKSIRTQKSQNGNDYRGLEWTHVLLGPDLEDAAIDIFDEDFVLVASGANDTETQTLRPNPQRKRKKVQIVVSNYLTETGVWYPACADETGELPWLTVVKVPAYQGPEGTMPGPGQVGADGIEFIVDDETSTLYKHGVPGVGPSGTVAVAAKLEAGAAITLPWRIFRCEPS
ncbi:MAG TPA: hypothetical protein PKA64_01965 [Myxococcota bacterium]|nr:hypothetical protein [Myxococcota bacterium]